MVITFDRHPLEVVAPERAPLMLATADERDLLLRKAGVDVVRMHFDEELRSLTAAEWIDRMHARLGARMLVVGYDNRFGSDGRTMGFPDYRRLGSERGVAVEEAPEIPGVSSTLIRTAVAAGNVESAAEMLGRRYSLEGIVVEGRAMGRRFGFPTANLKVDPRIALPARGVYAAMALLPDGREYPAVVNIGVRPTLANGNDISVEAHILDFSGSLYGEKVRLSFVARLRDERRFPTVDHLREAIAADIEALRVVL